MEFGLLPEGGTGGEQKGRLAWPPRPLSPPPYAPFSMDFDGPHGAAQPEPIAQQVDAMLTDLEDRVQRCAAAQHFTSPLCCPLADPDKEILRICSGRALTTASSDLPTSRLVPFLSLLYCHSQM